MKKKLRIMTLVLFFCFGISFCFQADASPYSKNGRLRVSSGTIVNEKGKAFVIQGVSTHGIAWYPDYINEKAFKTLRDDWGVNTIRLALYTSEYHGYCTDGNQKELKKQIDAGVKAASKLGMYVIIDWHILQDGNPKTHEKQAKAFFKEIAKKYSSCGNVMYEICNEPNGAGGSWKNIRSYAQAVIKTIRSVNKKAIVIVGTPTWSQDVDQALADPVKGQKNIAYAFHFYAGTHKESMRQKLEGVLKKKFPVIVTEFGISEASGNGQVSVKEGDAWIRLLDRYHTGRICWNLSNKAESSALIKSSCTKKSGWKNSDLTETGKWLIKTYKGSSKDTEKKQEAVQQKADLAAKVKKQVAGWQKLLENILKNAPETGKKNLKITMKESGSWESGSSQAVQYLITIKNTGKQAVSDWKISVNGDHTFSVNQSWNGNVKKKGKSLTITPVEWNEKLEPGQMVEIGLILQGKEKVSLK